MISLIRARYWRLLAWFLLGVALSGSAAYSQVSRDVPLTPMERGRLNIFFSNFSEAGVQPFDRGLLSDAQLIKFGIWHRYRNPSKNPKTPDFEHIPGSASKMRLRKERVDGSCLYFFGRKPTQHFSIKDYPFDGQGYIVSFGDGDPVPFSYVVAFRSLGANRYEAIVDDYEAHDFWPGYPNTPPSGREEFSGDPYTPFQQMRAVVRKVSGEGKPRYLLEEYHRVRKYSRQ
jgi:hypothetical protein